MSISSSITEGERDLAPENMSYPAIRDPNRRPTHPGAILREDVLPAVGKPKAEIARLLGISRQQLYDILEERRPISPAVAVRLGKMFGNGPGIWVRMQAAYDLWGAEREVDVSNIPTLEASRAA
jgi:addiction module HigA family antidote